MFEITELPREGAGRASAVIAEAMHDAPVFAWLIPEQEARRSLLPALMGAFVAESLATDRVLTDGTTSAFATWSLQESAVDPPSEDALPPVFAPYVPRILALQKAQLERRPERPHLYLPVIAVLPSRRGRGLGGALLSHRLTDTDLPAYLEASSERNAALYGRHGFIPLGEPITLPDGPDIRPMWREP